MTGRSRSRRVGELVAHRELGWSVQTPGEHDPRLDRPRGIAAARSPAGDRVLREQRRRPGSAREHFDASAGAADAVATAIFCATTAAGFAGALHKARCASGPMNAAHALTGALAGARLGAAATPSRLLNGVPPGAQARVLHVAADLLDAPDATLT